MTNTCSSCRLRFAILSLVVAVFGCSTPDVKVDKKLYHVTGRVTSGNKPVERIVVLLVPTGDGSRAKGITDPNGKFALLDESESPGVAAGEYRVVFQRLRLPVEKSQSPHVIPLDSSYQSVETTPVRVTVDRDTKDLTFDLRLNNSP